MSENENRKKIVLYGAGLEGEKFYWKYKNKYDVVCAVDKIHDRKFHEIPVYSFEKLKEMKLDYFIVVAAIGITYKAIKQGLEEWGRKEFADFVWARDFEKKLCVLYGNCHMIVLEEYLSNNPYFFSQYAIKRYFIHNDPYYCTLPSKEEMSSCDLLISQDVREGNSCSAPAVQEVCSWTKESCKCVVIPNLFGCNSFFPQTMVKTDKRKHIGGAGIVLEGKNEEEAFRISERVEVIKHDPMVIDLYKEGKNINEIVRILREEMLYPANEIQKRFTEELQKLEEREKHCDVKIAWFIKQYYKEEKLFYNPAHPTKGVICEMGRQCLYLLGIPVSERIPVKVELDEGEVYVYGCVKKALGLQFEETYMRSSNKGCTLAGRPVNLQEYVEEMISWAGF